MANMNRLRGRFIEAEISVEGMADRLGINRSTMYRKISEKGEAFTVREVNRMINVLHLTPEDAFSIFFTVDVA